MISAPWDLLLPPILSCAAIGSGCFAVAWWRERKARVVWPPKQSSKR